MPKYLWEASYSAEGAKGLLKDGGSKRRKAAEEAVKAVGGKLEAFYFAFGKYDAYVIADIPDHASVAAASLAVNASGAVTIRTTVLLTPEELEALPGIDPETVESIQVAVNSYYRQFEEPANEPAAAESSAAEEPAAEEAAGAPASPESPVGVVSIAAPENESVTIENAESSE